MAKPKKIDPFLMHELLHGACLVLDLLGEAADETTYRPIYAAHPDLRRRKRAAEDALADFYQAVGAEALK